MFMEHQSHRYSKNNPEHNWISWEATRGTKDYREQQQISYHKHSQYNERQQYRNNRAAKNASSYNAYKRVKLDHQSMVHMVITTPSRKHVPVIPHVNEQEHHKITSFFWKFYDDRKKLGA